MTPEDLIADLRSRINPIYASTLRTESYERKICVEAIESLVQERDAILAAIKNLKDVKGRHHTEQATLKLFTMLYEYTGSKP